VSRAAAAGVALLAGGCPAWRLLRGPSSRPPVRPLQKAARGGQAPRRRGASVCAIAGAAAGAEAADAAGVRGGGRCVLAARRLCRRRRRQCRNFSGLYFVACVPVMAVRCLACSERIDMRSVPAPVRSQRARTPRAFCVLGRRVTPRCWRAAIGRGRSGAGRVQARPAITRLPHRVLPSPRRVVINRTPRPPRSYRSSCRLPTMPSARPTARE
jgi:hypothetical protein